MTHTLRSYPQYFAPTLAGAKTHEVRSNADTGPFGVGDTLILREYDPNTAVYSGRTCTLVITYMSPDPKPWIVPGYNVMSTRMLDAS